MGRFEVGMVAAGRYEILRFIAAGGMGEVYAARDRILDTTIALKTLRPELEGSSVALERFRREIALAREVTSPNVCRMYDVGEHEGHVFLTMELLEGRRLETGIAFAELDRIAPQLVRGLTALHAKGIVHRDFKTSNIIVVGDRAVITDFGLARSLDDDAKLTLDSGLLGTPAYMAPEQVQGRPATPASDVYALGVVLFELCTGRLPFVEDTAMAAATARLLRDAPRPSSVRTGVPPKWDAIISRCLARDPAKRPPLAKVLASRDPNRRNVLIVGTVGLLGSVAGGYYAFKRGMDVQRAKQRLGRDTNMLPAQHVIAVLPVGDGPEEAATLFDDPLRTAITIDLYEQLTTVGYPLVEIFSQMMDRRLAGPAMKWAAAKKPVDAAFAFAHVNRVVTMRIARRTDTTDLVVRITTRDKKSTSHRLSRPHAEVAKLAHDAALLLCVREADFGKPRYRDPAMTAEQYTQYGAGLAHLYRDPDAKGAGRPLREFSDAVPAHARAAAIAAEYALSWAEQMNVYAQTQELLGRVSGLVDRALAADPDHALAHAVRGHAAMVAWDWKRADEDTARAVELAPTYARLQDFHRGFFLQLQGRWEELIAIVKRNLPVDDRIGNAYVGYLYYYAREYEKAIETIAPKLDAFDYTQWIEGIWAAVLAGAYSELGRHDEALATVAKLLPKVDAYASAMFVPVYLAAGRIDDAKALRDKLYATNLDLTEQALIDDAFGDREAALGKLEQVVEAHNVGAMFLKIARCSSALRAEPRFHALMQKVGFL